MKEEKVAVPISKCSLSFLSATLTVTLTRANGLCSATAHSPSPAVLKKQVSLCAICPNVGPGEEKHEGRQYRRALSNWPHDSDTAGKGTTSVAVFGDVGWRPFYAYIPLVKRTERSPA